MDAITVTNSKGTRFRIENYAPGERTKGGGDKQAPAIGVFDLSAPDVFGEQGQFVSAYLRDDLPRHGGLNLHMGSPSWQLDGQTMDRIRAWLAHLDLPKVHGVTPTTAGFSSTDGATVAGTPGAVAMFTLLQLLHALALEINTGMVISSRGSVLKVTQGHGLTTKRTKKGALADVLKAVQAVDPAFKPSASVSTALGK